MRVVAFALLAIAALVPRAAASDPELGAGAWELGLAGALISSDAGHQSTVSAHAARFVGLAQQLFSLEAGIAYGHVRQLDELEVTGRLAWHARAGTTYPFVGALAGVRREWVGSFHQTRTPLGGIAGLRALLAPRVAVRVEYRLARILDPDVASFSEHQVLLGFVYFLREGRRESSR